MNSFAEFSFSILSLILSTLIPICLPYVIVYVKSRIHNARVSIYMEAGLNAAGRIAIKVAEDYATGKLTRAEMPYVVRGYVIQEAVKVSTMIPETMVKLNKDVPQLEEMIIGKLGQNASNLIPVEANYGRSNSPALVHSTNIKLAGK